MATNSTDFTSVTFDLPALASGTIRLTLAGLLVNSANEVFEPGHQETISLDENGVATENATTPDRTGDSSATWLAQSQENGGTTWVNLGLIVLGYSASAQALGTLLNSTAVASAIYANVTLAQQTWLAAELAAIGATADGNLLQSDGANAEDSGIVATNVSGHIASTSNPHSVTSTQVDALPIDAGIVSVASGRDLTGTDNGKILEATGTISINCPDSLDTGFQVAICNVGSGTITITATTTLQSKGSAVTLDTQYAMATLYHRGSNVWLLAGDIA